MMNHWEREEQAIRNRCERALYHAKTTKSGRNLGVVALVQFSNGDERAIAFPNLEDVGGFVTMKIVACRLTK